MVDYASLLVYAALLGAPAFIFWDGISKKRELDAARNEARLAFENSRIESNNPRFAFNGSTATIVKIEEPDNPYRQPTAWFTLTIFARNDFGEYFMFKSIRPKPLVKHIAHSVARQVLKGEYLPPIEA